MGDIWLLLSCHAIELSTVVLVLAFTSADSPIRPGLFPLLVVLCAYTIRLEKRTFPNVLIYQILNMHSGGLVFQYLDYGLISKWTYPARGPTSPRGGQHNAGLSLVERKKLERGPQTLWDRLRWGLAAATSWRASGTPWQTRGVAPAVGHGRFLARNLLTIAASVLAFDAVAGLLQMVGLRGARGPGDMASRFAWDRVRLLTRLGDVSGEEAVVRAVVTLAFWVATYTSIQAFHCLQAVVCVATGLTTVDIWPPMFGSVTEAYTIRQFWGNFWHKAIRQKIGSPAYYTTYSLLGLKKGGWAGRYMHILLVFTTSALYHLVVLEYVNGIRWHHTGTMNFFCTQALGIFLEDSVQAGFRFLTGYKHSRWTAAVGYAWVVLWLYWTSPARDYPRLQVSHGKKEIQSRVLVPLLRVLRSKVWE